MVTSLSGSLSVLLLTFAFGLPNYIVPSFRDATIRTRTGTGSSMTLQTLYLRGARTRTEFRTEDKHNGEVTAFGQIMQCDVRQSVRLDFKHQTFAIDRLDNLGERAKASDFRLSSQQPTHGGDVNVTVEAVDLGERRQLGDYTVRHLRVMTRVAPGPDACTHSSVEEREGWYLDVSGMGCSDRNEGFLVGMSSSGSCQDRVHVRRLGDQLGGYPIEEIVHKTDAGRELPEIRTQLVDFTIAPLEARLFEKPAGFKRALWTPSGYDMTRADNVTNHANEYWQKFARSIRDWMR